MDWESFDLFSPHRSRLLLQSSSRHSFKVQRNFSKLSVWSSRSWPVCNPSPVLSARTIRSLPALRSFPASACRGPSLLPAGCSPGSRGMSSSATRGLTQNRPPGQWLPLPILQVRTALTTNLSSALAPRERPLHLPYHTPFASSHGSQCGVMFYCL